MTLWLFPTKSRHREAEASKNGVGSKSFKGTRFIRTLPVLLLGYSLTACSLSGNPADGLESEPDLVTGSISRTVEIEGIDPTDAEAIKLTVANAESAEETSNLLAWSNPETGSSGTITAIDRYIGTHGQSCKKFRTTVDSFMGISLYKGETCELKTGFWVLSWFIRDAAE